jgi:hypothetical protein
VSLFEVTYIALWVLVIVLAVGVYALYYHFGEMYLTSPEGRATQGPKVGERLNSAHATSLEGPTLELPRTSRRTVLVFTAPDCAVCRELLDDLVADGDPDILDDVIVVASGATADAEKWLGVIPATRIVIDPRAGLRARYGIGLTPFGVAADMAGVVRTRGVVSTASNLRGLVKQARIDEQSSIDMANTTGRTDLVNVGGSS